MKAAAEKQALLLDLADLDARLIQLTHRAKTLPEIEELADAMRWRGEQDGKVIDARTSLSDAQRELTKVDDSVTQIRSKLDRDQARLVAGSGNARELTSLQEEVESLRRRQDTLEEAELEAMEAVEEATTALAANTDALGTLDARISELTDKKAAALKDIEAQRGTAAQRREALVQSLPEDLMTLYTRAAARAGTGAALLKRGACQGCRMEMSPVDLSKVRAAAEEDVLQCEDCERILVRTKESGL